MVGITRFEIIDGIKGRGGQRISEARRYWSIANSLYRQIFNQLGMPLAADEEVITCTKEKFEAGYDYQLGIDLIIRPIGQGESTMQEKFLLTDFNTVTVEHCQNWMTLERGDWYNLKAQYYFVGYDPNKSLHLNPWVLLDWVRVQRATAQGRIIWHLQDNDRNKVGALASFMYVKFSKLPPDVIVKSSQYTDSMF